MVQNVLPLTKGVDYIQDRENIVANIIIDDYID